MKRLNSFLKSHIFSTLLAGSLILGVISTGWVIVRADHGIRSDLLKQAQLAAHTISLEDIQTLTGTPADLDSHEYQSLKQFLVDVQKTDSHYRFAYLMGRKADGSIVFLVDAEPSDSPDYSPPGEIYSEASDVVRRVFESKIAAVDGPVSDRWGTWVSPLVPIINPDTGEVKAVVGIDIAADDWYWALAARSALPIGLMMVILILLIAAFAATRKVKYASHTVLKDMLLPLSAILLLLIAGSSFLFWQQQQQRLNELTALQVSAMDHEFSLVLEQQTSALSLALQPIATAPGVQQALAEHDTSLLLTHWQARFEGLKQDYNITHFYFMDADRFCLLRVHKPDKYGDRIDRYTTL